jgi:putative phosphoesterase
LNGWLKIHYSFLKPKPRKIASVNTVLGAGYLTEKVFRHAKLIGIISDSHDNIFLIDEAVKKLNELGVGLVLHAGDYISPFTVQYFKPLKAKLVGVFGNNCAERAALKKLFAEIGADIQGFFSEIVVEDLKIALLHGHEEELLRSLIESEVYDLVVHGHTHRIETARKGRTTVINPGEICGYLSGNSTLTVYDVKTRNAKTVPVSP